MLRELGEAPIATPVWDGTRLLGHIVQRLSGQVKAVPANGSSLGFFNAESRALAALIEAGHG